MPNTTTSPNMALELPNVSTAPGPQWATDLNSALTGIDAHNHAPGNGLPVGSNGLNINSDLPFNNNNATSVRSMRFGALSSPASSGTDTGAMYVSSQDLYYNDTLGRSIRLTGGGVALGSSGNIVGLVAPANLTYSSGTSTFVFQSSATVSGNIDVRNILIRNATPGSTAVTISVPSSAFTAWTMTLPSSAGIAGQYLATNNGTGTLGFLSPPNQPYELNNIGLAASVASNSLTVSLRTRDGSEPSSGNPIRIGFRSVDASTGTYLQITSTSAISVTASSGSTLGHSGGNVHYIYAYAINNVGRVELGLSTSLFDEGVLQSSTAEAGAGGADSNMVLYSTSARTSVPIRLLGRMRSNQTTAGVWAAVPTQIALPPWDKYPTNVYVEYNNNGGETLTADVTNMPFTTRVADTHNAFASGIFTAPENGVYSMIARGNFTTNASHNARAWVNGVGSYYINNADNTTSVSHYSLLASLVRGDAVSIRSDTNFTLLSSSTQHFITITRVG